MAKKLLKSLIIFQGLLFLGSGYALETNQQKPLNETSTSEKVLTLQTFKHDDLTVKFRYEDKNLTGIELENTSKQPLVIHVLEESYILGSGDSTVINPPAIKYLRITYAPYSVRYTAIGNILKDRFTNHEIYAMPTYHDKVVVE